MRVCNVIHLHLRFGPIRATSVGTCECLLGRSQKLSLFVSIHKPCQFIRHSIMCETCPLLLEAMLHTLLHNQDGGKRASVVALPSGMRIICSTCLFPLIYHPQTSLEQLLPLTFICLGCQSGTDVTDCHTTCQPMSTPVLDKRGFHASSALGGLEGGVKIKVSFY